MENWNAEECSVGMVERLQDCKNKNYAVGDLRKDQMNDWVLEHELTLELG